MSDRRIWMIAAAGLPLLLTASPPAWPAEPSIRVQDAAVMDNYQAFIDRLASEIAGDGALAGEGADNGPVIYFDPNLALDQVPDFGSLSLADQAMLRASKRTYDLYRALGGDPIDRFAVVQREGNRFYLGFDGEGGRWLATPLEALSYMLAQLIHGSLLPPQVKDAVAQCPYHFECLLRATYTGLVDTMAYVPRGTTVTFEMTGEGFRAAGGPPVVHATQGFIVHQVSFLDSEMITARVSIDDTAALGLNVLDVYNEGAAFRAVGRYGVHVVAGAAELDPSLAADAAMLEGSGAVEGLSDDFSADPATAAALTGSLSGRLETTGDADLFKIVVEQPGTLAVNSAGPTDLMGTLETASGSIVVADDDSGQWYNFALSQSLDTGTYYLRVTHCCAGTGDYRLTTTFTPN
ncbi:MAG: hypothetical protein ACE5JZ_01465 [Kiloniellales bacterium]